MNLLLALTQVRDSDRLRVTLRVRVRARVPDESDARTNAGRRRQ